MARLEGTRILFRHIPSARSAAGPVFAMASPTLSDSLETQSLPEAGEQPDVLPRRGREMRYTFTACLLIALVYVLSFSWISSVLHQEYGFPLDDSWIHQTAGRNLALHGRPGIDPETGSSGTTSLLWTLIQAVNYKWLGPVDPVRYNEALSYLLLIFTGPLLFLLTRSDRTSIGVRWILAVSPAVMGNFLWLGMIGMEHLLFVVLSLAGICLWFQPGAGRRGNAFACGCISGLLALTRPEDACFGPFLVLLASSSTYLHRSLRDRLILLGVWILFLAGWIAGEIRTSGSILPTTMKGRSWLYFHATGGPHSLHTILRFLGSWVQRLPRQFGTEFTRQLHYVGGIASPLALLGIALLALMLVGFIYLMRVGGSATRALLLWAWVQFCIYLVIFPAAGHGGRYQPLNLMLILPLLLTGFLALLRGMRLPDTAVVGAAGAALLVAGVLSLHTWRVVTLVGIRHINQTERQSAMWIRNHLAPGTEVGAFDIGRVSYEGSARIVDLGGLSDPAYMPYLTQGRVPEFLRLQGIRYVMLPSSGMEDLGFTPAYERHKLAEYCSPQEEWLLGFRYTIHAARCQEIYELPAQ